MLWEKVMEYHKRGDEEAVKVLMAINGGPLLKGLKSAVILSVENRLVAELVGQLQMTPYGYFVLNRGKRKHLMLLFHICRFRDYLSSGATVMGLAKYGYHVSGTATKQENMMCALFELAEKMTAYFEGKTEFPHEIGYFLEYPEKDVEMFIRYKGQNYLLTGYWKVYHDPDRARETFARFDQAKESALMDVMSGKRLCDLAT